MLSRIVGKEAAEKCTTVAAAKRVFADFTIVDERQQKSVAEECTVIDEHAKELHEENARIVQFKMDSKLAVLSARKSVVCLHYLSHLSLY